MGYVEKIKNKIAGWRDYDKEKREFRVYNAWLLILASFALLLILIVWFGGTLFWSISHDRFWSPKNALMQTKKDVIDKGRLERVLARYAKQRELLETRKGTRSFVVADPSI